MKCPNCKSEKVEIIPQINAFFNAILYLACMKCGSMFIDIEKLNKDRGLS